ncbi:MAG: hypothetical protein Q8N18_14635 [Opitutaceae bacterium]|nr:hypothetical protein [Opitutaceae bacterium]
MKTTIELPDPLFRRAKVVAAQRGTTLRGLVIEGLRHVTVGPAAAAGLALTTEESAVATVGKHGLPVLRRSGSATRAKVTRALVDRIRDELTL